MLGCCVGNETVAVSTRLSMWWFLHDSVSDEDRGRISTPWFLFENRSRSYDSRKAWEINSAIFLLAGPKKFFFCLRALFCSPQASGRGGKNSPSRGGYDLRMIWFFVHDEK